ncbi:hypothetical protein E2C01_095810 [Portunus trituberculatus]|uniref:Uncharacterized protein n=1 Tax=Portunus trituberculatus TaxID=210409 RepID=A0A5B7K6N6_PORTR|nr:hypothetical protein [Portunus trituberculatus]
MRGQERRHVRQVSLSVSDARFEVRGSSSDTPTRSLCALRFMEYVFTRCKRGGRYLGHPSTFHRPPGTLTGALLFKSFPTHTRLRRFLTTKKFP